MSQVLSLDTLGKLDDGRIVKAVDHALKQITRDVQDRPGDKSKRMVVLTILATPQLAKDTAVLDTVAVQFRVKATTPVRQSQVFPMLPTNQGALMFQEHSPNDPRQTELSFDQRQQQINRDVGTDGGGNVAAKVDKGEGDDAGGDSDDEEISPM